MTQPYLKMASQVSSNTGRTGEPIRTNNWELTINGVESFNIPTDTPYFINSAGVPSYSIDPIELAHFNEKAYVAGMPSLDGMTLEITDVVDPNIAQGFRNWSEAVYNPNTGEIGYVAEYKKDGILYQYDTKGVIIRQWQVIGMWPTKVDIGKTLDVSAAASKINVELKVDRCVISWT